MKDTTITTITTITQINVIAYLNMFNYKMVNLVNMHESDSRPKQFEDQFGNLWFASELSNFQNLNTGA
jgi:hypothetical protein